MRVFEVSLNGERLCVAGVDGDGVLNAMVDRVKINARDDLRLRVGALVSATEEHRIWTQAGLKVGDEVRVRILESDSVDEPKSRTRRGEQEQLLEDQENYVREFARKLGWTLTEPPDPLP